MKELNLNVPAAIILAGVIIAGAIVFSLRGFEGNVSSKEAAKDTVLLGNSISMNPISEADHLLGNPNAPVTIVVYSDFECPFCKQFHQTMKQVMEAYGKSGDGRVAWVYRHFPLDSIHPKARTEAEASECAAELGGQVAYWDYADKIFEITPSNNGLDLALLPDIAEEIGLSRKDFESCLNSKRHAEDVQNDLVDAQKAGGRGTPYSVIVTKSGKTAPLSGALPFEAVKELIDQVLKAEE